MHDEREWRQCAAAAEIAGAGESEDPALSSCNSDHTSHHARGPTVCEFRTATDTIPITRGWDQRPGADLPHFAQLSRKTPRTLLVLSGKIRTAFLEAVASDSASILRLCLLVGTIVMAFGLGWFCGSTLSPSRTAGKETVSRTGRLLLPGVVPEKGAVSITGTVGSSVPAPAMPTTRNVTASSADTRKPLSAAQVSASPQSTQLAAAQQATTSPGVSASHGELNSGPRLTPAPETSPATIQGWSVRDVYGGTVVLVGADRVWTVRLGDYVPGVGRINSITRWGSHWIVVTTSGLISTQ